MQAKWQKPIRDLPNRAGFEFTLYFWDGRSERATVIRGDDGCHRIALISTGAGVVMSEVCGWTDK